MNFAATYAAPATPTMAEVFSQIKNEQKKKSVPENLKKDTSTEDNEDSESESAETSETSSQSEEEEEEKPKKKKKKAKKQRQKVIVVNG